MTSRTPDRPVSRGLLAGAPGSQAVHIDRFTADERYADLVRHAWVPRWSLPPGRRVVQEVLQYPGGNLVVEPDVAAFHGVDAGLGRRELTGTGWAVGLLLRPAAGYLLLRRPMAEVVALTLPEPAAGLGEAAAAVRARMPAHPADASRLLQDWLADATGAADEEGLVANEVVRLCEEQPEVTTVADVARAVGLSVRGLQRLCHRRIGLSPKWLLQRRRLQDAAARLGAQEPVELADLAVELGYADQAHFTRDFAKVVGVPPGRFGRRAQRTD